MACSLAPRSDADARNNQYKSDGGTCPSSANEPHPRAVLSVATYQRGSHQRGQASPWAERKRCGTPGPPGRLRRSPDRWVPLDTPGSWPTDQLQGSWPARLRVRPATEGTHPDHRRETFLYTLKAGLRAACGRPRPFRPRPISPFIPFSHVRID